MNIKKSYKPFLTITLFLIFIITIFAPINVFAARDVEITCPCGVAHDYNTLSGLQFIDYTVDTTVKTGALFSMAGDGTQYNINSILKFDVTNYSSVFYTLWNNAKGVYNKLIFLGQILATIYFLLGLMDKLFTTSFSAEHLVRELIKYFATLIVISQGFTIIEYALGLSSIIYDKLTAAQFDQLGVGSSCYFTNAANRKNIWESIGNMLLNLFPYIFLQISQAIIRIVAWKRVLEIVVRVMFAPIGMADSISNGVNSSGIRYVKKILAGAIQGSLILAVSIAFNLIKGELTAPGSLGVFTGLGVVLLAGVCVTLILRTASLSREIMGV
jgi:hypothetical protein